MNKTIQQIRQEIRKKINEGLRTGSFSTTPLEQLLDFIDNLSDTLPLLYSRSELNKFACQCVCDLSNEWEKDNPDWKDVETACKLGANWERNKIVETAIDGLVICNHLTHGYKDIVMSIPENLEVGDKVKVVIIKENGEETGSSL